MPRIRRHRKLKRKPRRRLRRGPGSRIPQRRSPDRKPEAALGSRRSSISRQVPARRSKAATTQRRASVRKPTKARRAGPRGARPAPPPGGFWASGAPAPSLPQRGGAGAQRAPKAAVQVLLLGFGIEPALLLSEAVY